MPGHGTPGPLGTCNERQTSHRPDVAVLLSGRAIPPLHRGIAASDDDALPGPGLRRRRDLLVRGRAGARPEHARGQVPGRLAVLSAAEARPEARPGTGGRTPVNPGVHQQPYRTRRMTSPARRRGHRPWRRRAGLLLAVLCTAVLTACGGGPGAAATSPDLADQDRFLHDYVTSLNESDESGLARLLRAHPQGDRDARARIEAYGGQGWDVRWSRTSEFARVWKVDLVGTARSEDEHVRVTETVTWEDGDWVMSPLPGVVPTPSNAAGTEPP